MVWVNTSPLVKTYTLEEFWELPEPPDHSKLELIAGVLYMTPLPGHPHDTAVSRLIRLLTEFLTYAVLGVKELWLVDETGECVEVRNPSEGRLITTGRFEKGNELSSQVFPELHLEVEKIFVLPKVVRALSPSDDSLWPSESYALPPRRR